MSAFQFRVEMRVGQDMRFIDADSFSSEEQWMIFYRKRPEGGGAHEYWRVRMDTIVSMETKRNV